MPPCLKGRRIAAGEAICDPACGTGGFLLGAYQHILTQHTSKELLKPDEHGMMVGLVGDKLTDERQWQVLREATFNGYDFDSTMVRIGLMNLMLHGIDKPNLDYKDTLSKRYDEKDCYDVVLANPPFKGSIDKGDINEDLSLKTTKTELLFVNRIINLLRIGGRSSVIVPDGVLFGSSKAHQALRKMLIEDGIIDNKYDLSINRYKEIEYDEVEYDPPQVILSQLRVLETEIMADLDELEGMIEKHEPQSTQRGAEG